MIDLVMLLYVTISFIRHLTTGTPLDESLRLEDIARRAESFSGADLESLVCNSLMAQFGPLSALI